jgi:hypothetical protein
MERSKIALRKPKRKGLPESPLSKSNAGDQHNLIDQQYSFGLVVFYREVGCVGVSTGRLTAKRP